MKKKSTKHTSRPPTKRIPRAECRQGSTPCRVPFEAMTMSLFTKALLLASFVCLLFSRLRGTTTQRPRQFCLHRIVVAGVGDGKGVGGSLARLLS